MDFSHHQPPSFHSVLKTDTAHTPTSTPEHPKVFEEVTGMGSTVGVTWW